MQFGRPVNLGPEVGLTTLGPLPKWACADVPLALHTTLELGGPARVFADVADEAELVRALQWARDRGLGVFVLGGGSNLVVGDGGFDGLVVRLRLLGRDVLPVGAGTTRVDVAAGEPWDPVVEACVAANLAGLECLSGIPGSAGATPIQNVGAYGQEVGSVIERVRVLDADDLRWHDLRPDDCGFAYRHSRFKREPGRWIVSRVSFLLREQGAPTLRYPELRRAMGDLRTPGLAETRAAVLSLRRAKSMVIEPGDPNRRSVGSFFTNPVVPDPVADRLVADAVDAGLVEAATQVPRYPAEPGFSKLAAAWLIERSGISRGFRRGPVGVSSRHTLALVHHGGGTTRALLELAYEIRTRVLERFAVELEPEPVLLSASWPPT
jgi:UDP-N-acetylmuramate dehydrogenase